MFVDQDCRQLFRYSVLPHSQKLLSLFSKLWQTSLLEYRNLLHVLPLSYHFCQWSKQRCHTFSTMGYRLFCLTIYAQLHPGVDPASKVRGGGAISVIFIRQPSLTTGSQLQERWSIIHNTAMTKQSTAKLPYNANVIFRIVQNHGK